MATIADLLIKLRVDSKGAEQDLASFGGKAKAGINKGVLPAVAVLGALGLAAKGATDDATKLGESQNAVSVVFGKSSTIVNDFAKNAAREAGLSMADLNGLVTPVGAGLLNVGFSADEAATASVNLARRAADMASVFNTSVPDALTAIQAGLRGEADPLERFGVGLNDAAVSAKAVALGLADSTAAVSPQAKAQARLALIMEQTNRLQGDFVNTSDSAANKARVNAAEQENLSATMGRGLLPVVTTLQSAVGALTGFMAKHTTITKVATGIVAGLAVAVLGVAAAQRVSAAATVIASAVKGLFTTSTATATAATAGQTVAQHGLNTAMRANPIGIIVTALAVLGGALVLAWKNSETFRDVVLSVWDAVKDAAQTVFGAIAPVVLGVFNAIKGYATSFYNTFKGLFDTFAGLFSGNWGRMWDGIKTIASNILGGLPARMLGFLGAIGGAAVDLGQRAVNGIGQGISTIATKVGSFIDDIPGKIRSYLGAIGGAAIDLGERILNGIGSGLASLGSKLVGWIKTPINAIIGAVNRVTGRINSALQFSVDTKIPGVGKVGFNAPDIPPIPQLAKGGIVSHPTLALIGEAGPEAVVPLGRGGGFGNIHVEIVDRTVAGMSPETRRALVEELAPEFRRVLAVT